MAARYQPLRLAGAWHARGVAAWFCPKVRHLEAGAQTLIGRKRQLK